ncbi:MAG: winged helix-turn-helix domain-containing protein [Vicinamibacterales bacterium]
MWLRQEATVQERPGPDRFRFEDFEFDPRTLELFRDGRLVRLQRQPAQVLRALLERAGNLVARDELRLAIWGEDRYVDVDRSLAYCLRQIRIALEDDPAVPRFVETLRGLGYRFVGRIESADAAAVEAPAPAAAPVTPSAAPAAHGTAAAAASGTDARPAHASWTIAAWIAASGATVALGLFAWRATSPAQGGPRHEAGRVTDEVLLDRADDYLSRDRIDDTKAALTIYRRVLEAAPDSARAMAGAASAEVVLAWHNRDFVGGQAALLKANEAWRIAPSDPHVLAARARGLHAAGRMSDAADAYRVAIRAAPRQADLLDDLAMLEHQRGRDAEAVRILARRWRSFEPHPRPAGLLGVALGTLGFEDAAADWMRVATELAPDNGQSRYWAGVTALRAGRLDEAERLVAPMVEGGDPGALVVSLASVVRASRDGPAAALPRLTAAVDAMPEAIAVRSLLADIYDALGRDADARRARTQVVARCERGAADAPESPVFPRCLAAQTALAGDVDAAIGWYARAVDLGWRQVAGDGRDGRLDRLRPLPAFRALQARMTADLARMREDVERTGVPRPF